MKKVTRAIIKSYFWIYQKSEGWRKCQLSDGSEGWEKQKPNGVTIRGNERYVMQQIVFGLFES